MAFMTTARGLLGSSKPGTWITRNAPSLSWAILALGALAQVANFLCGHSLWLDEAYLSFNFLTHSPAQLLGPTDFSQIAPAGWMQLEALSFGWTGSYEYGLRALPVAAGLASLWLYRRLAFQVLGAGGALAALAILCFSPQVVAYAVMVKPYSVDVLAAVCILSLAYPMFQDGSPTLKDLARLGIAGLVFILVSFPAVYVLAGVGSVLFLGLLRERRWRDAAILALVCAAWLATFAALYLIIYKPQVQAGTLEDAGTQQFFKDTGFVPYWIQKADDAVRFVTDIAGWFEFYFTKIGQIPALIACLAGTVVLFRKAPAFTAALAVTVLAALAGSAAQAYPLYDRFTLFLFPAIALAIGAALGALLKGAAWRWLLGAGLAALVMVGPLKDLQWWMRRDPPFAMAHVTPALKALSRQWRPGDGLYVQASSAPAFLVYRRQFGLRSAPWSVGYQPNWACLAGDPAVLKQARTFVLATIDVGSRAMPSFGDADRRQLERSGFDVNVIASRPDLRLLELRKHPGASQSPPSGCERQWLYRDLETVLRTYRLGATPSPPRS